MYITINDQTEFEWNEDKNILNHQKHQISFEEALVVFTDPYALQNYDEEHSYDDERWIVLGRAGKELVLFVVCAESRNKIRLISARKATPNERRNYYEKIYAYIQNQAH
jgi:uncharacterized DUF497 family protein